MMIRLNSKYCSSLFLQIFLVLILCGSLTAAEEGTGSATDTPIVTEGSIITDAAANETGYYLYNPVGKTDPFKSFIVEREEAEKSKEKTYLETVELSQLELVSIAIGSKGRWAVVRDSKNMGYVIKEGTAIGTNNGIVSKITEKEIVIKEEIENFRGETQSREIIKVSKSQQQVE